MYHQLRPTSSTQLCQPHCIPYDRNLYLTVTSPDLPGHDREILSSKALTEITSVHIDLHLYFTPGICKVYFKDSDSLIIEQKLEKESTESDEQKSSSSAEAKSTSSEPRLSVKPLQLSRIEDGNDCSNQ